MTSPPPRAAIVGLGLIGGSLGIDLRTAGWRVGYLDPAVPPDQAGAAADEPLTWDRLDAFDPDLVVLATPLDVAIGLIESAPLEGRLATSVCSLMLPVRDAARKRGLRLVAGHPFAGSERGGAAAARAGLFRDRPWFLEEGSDGETVLACLRAAGASPTWIDSAAHDAALAVTSQLPQLLSTALGSVIGADYERLAPFLGEGVRTFLRLSGSSFEVWNPLFVANRSALAEADARVREAARRIAAGEGRDDFERARALWSALSRPRS